MGLIDGTVVFIGIGSAAAAAKILSPAGFTLAFGQDVAV
jgi:hypothetical protein